MALNNNYRCSVCGGDMAWDPDVQKIRCPYCGTTFLMEDMQEQGMTTFNKDSYEKGQSAKELGYTESTDGTDVNPEDLRVYKCKYCASEIITDKNTAATTCVYCGNPVVLEEQLVNGFTPKWVIPFKIKKEDVKDKYLSFIKRKFTPKSFLTDQHIEKIKGVYVPFWLYDGDIDGGITYEAEKTSTHKSGDYMVTEHDVYKVVRDGNMHFEKIPADASKKIDNAIMDSIEPFDYTDIKLFEMPYLAGFFAEKYDEDANVCSSRIYPRVINTFKDKLDETIKYSTKKLISYNHNEKITKSEYAMLPVYLLYTKYNGKDIVFAMNGQTGKMMGDIPFDKKRIMIYATKLFSISTVILTALMYFFS